MRNYITTCFCMVLLATALTTRAQTPAPANNVALIINGKQYSTNAAIPKSELQNLESNYPEIINLTTNQRYKAESFEWVISLADSNGIWKATLPKPSAPACTPGCPKLSYNYLLALMNPNDLIFIDNIKLQQGSTVSPYQFSLRPL